MPGSNHRTICKFGDHETERFNPVGLAITELVQAVLITRSKPELPIISELPISTPTFYGRSTELETLFDVLDPTLPGQHGIVIFGIGGSGKTQLTLKYIKDKKKLYSAVVWINASTSEQLTQSLTDAFYMISNSWTHKDRSNTYSGENKRDFVLARLRSTLKRNWLLVIDSADDPNSINLAQLIPDCIFGAIIVTSMRRDASDILEPYGFESIELDNLGDADGAELILDRARISVPSHRSSDAILIVRELGGLPLALEQAGILLRRRVVGLDNFITEYHTQYKELMGHLPRAGEVQHDKSRSMYTVLSILYSNVKTESPIAATILRLLAVIGPTQVPISIFLNIFQFDSKIPTTDIELQSIQNSSKSVATFRLHMTLLEDLCLVKIKPASIDHLESVLLHRAVSQWITKSPSECEPRWVIFVALGLGNVLCRGEGSLDWPMGGTTSDSYISRICLSWIDHIDFLIRESIDSSTIQPPHGLFAAEYANIACNFGYIYFCNARHDEAQVFLSCALSYYPFISATDDDFPGGILRLYYCLAVSYYETGNLGKAEEFLNAAFNNSGKESNEYAKMISLQQLIWDKTATNQHHQSSAGISAHRENIRRGKQPVQPRRASQKDEHEKADAMGCTPDAALTTSFLRAAAATFDDAIDKGYRALDPLRRSQGVGVSEWEVHRLISLHLPARVKAHIVKRATMSSLENNTTATKEILLEDSFYRRILARSTEHLGI
ncbi:P-loop containing nucleoside triphosphate hydrolase protein [Daldinia vernicosa]|uniref:P-loop containing nucleoside triphosphate hydrolase protein n=1 Tax=Daldinia vernicosa TaxID=114800 RepID=UPI0020086D90|nr:P-loop containing nucleoside triphosphate hydrolase protein [Daldinia vernicosa]KAI0848567.1 P-loop containing nucleoside triphosphate hydrolase protein [Daldinia vernicosa]